MRRPTTIDLTHDVPEQVRDWLEEAAVTLSALPVHGLYPAGARSGWPDIVRDLEDLGWDCEAIVRPSRPSADAVTRFDQVMGWLSLLDGDDVPLRRIVNMRLIVHPISQNHKWSWEKIGKAIGVSHHTAKARHGQACAVIGKKLRRASFSPSKTSVFAVF